MKGPDVQYPQNPMKIYILPDSKDSYHTTIQNYTPQ